MADKYVASNGSDSNDGTAPTDEGGGVGPWATLHYAFNYGNGSSLGNSDPVVAGDVLHLVMHTSGASIGTASYTDEVRMATAGTHSAPITIVGANAAGDIDGTLGVFDATGITDVFNGAFNVRQPYYVFRNLKIEGDGSAPSAGIEYDTWSGTGPVAVAVFINVHIDNVNGDGFVTSSSPSQIAFINCLASNCIGDGFRTTNGIEALNAGVAYGCSAIDNDIYGFGDFGLTINCIATGNNGGTSSLAGFGEASMIANCTAYDNDAAGFFFADECGVIINSVGYNNGNSTTDGYGANANNSRVNVIMNSKLGANEDGASNNINLEIDVDTTSDDPFVGSSTGNFNPLRGSDVTDVAYPTTWEELSIESPSEIGAMMVKKPDVIRVG